MYDINPTTLRTDIVSLPSSVGNMVQQNSYYDDTKADGSGSLTDTGPLKSVSAANEWNEPLASVSYDYDDGKLSSINRTGYKYTFDDSYSGGTEYLSQTVHYSSSSQVSVTSGNDSLRISKNLYDETGGLKSTIYGNLNYAIYDNDILGRLITKTTLRDTLSYVYNSKGMLASVSSSYNNTSHTYSYDMAGRLSVDEFYNNDTGAGIKHKYLYDTMDLIGAVKTTVNDGAGINDSVYTQYDYDNDNRVISKKTQEDTFQGNYIVPKIDYSYNEVGLLTGTTHTGGNSFSLTTPIEQAIHYRTVGNDPTDLTSYVQSYENKCGGGSLGTYGYSYDNVGNITNVTGDYYSAATYAYDGLNQLVSADNTFYDENYTYDSNGNITTKAMAYTEQGYSTTNNYTYNYDTVWKDRLTSVTLNGGNNIRSYSYDDMTVGPTLPTTDGVFNYTWDNRMLIHATKISDYTQIDYMYDEEGMRIQKTVSKTDGSFTITKFFYTDGELSDEIRYVQQNGEMVADKKLSYIYDGTGLAYVVITMYNTNYGVSPGTYTYYVVRNAQGDVKNLVYITPSGSAESSLSYCYSAYGEFISNNTNSDYGVIASLCPMLYKGYYYDSETGMYYLGSRYYDPEVGRFLSGDAYVSTGQGILGLNMFAYCANNPINRADSSGQCWYDANGNWCHDNWEYIGGYVRKPDPNAKSNPTKTSPQGVKFIGNYEGGYHSTPYDDGYGNPTIGYGHLIKKNESFTTITKQQALQLMSSDLYKFEKSITEYSNSIGVVWNQNQYDAFVDLAFNAGSNYKGVMDDIVAGMDPYAAFSQVIKAGGEKSLGLYRRRMDEADMFCNGTNNRTYREW